MTTGSAVPGVWPLHSSDRPNDGYSSGLAGFGNDLELLPVLVFDLGAEFDISEYPAETGARLPSPGPLKASVTWTTVSQPSLPGGLLGGLRRVGTRCDLWKGRAVS